MADQQRPDLNTASKEELMRAHGIGEEMAERIIENRPYRSAEDIDRIHMVGDERLDFLKDSFRAGGSERQSQQRGDEGQR